MKKIIFALSFLFSVPAWSQTAYTLGGYNSTAVTITLQAGGGNQLPAAPVTCDWWDYSLWPASPSSDPHLEIILVTYKNGDTITVTRGFLSSAYNHNNAAHTYAIAQASNVTPIPTNTATPTPTQTGTPTKTNTPAPGTNTPTNTPTSAPGGPTTVYVNNWPTPIPKPTIIQVEGPGGGALTILGGVTVLNNVGVSQVGTWYPPYVPPTSTPTSTPTLTPTGSPTATPTPTTNIGNVSFSQPVTSVFSSAQTIVIYDPVSGLTASVTANSVPTTLANGLQTFSLVAAQLASNPNQSKFLNQFSPADGTAALYGLTTWNQNAYYNGTSWDRARTSQGVTYTTPGLGVQAVGFSNYYYPVEKITALGLQTPVTFGGNSCSNYGVQLDIGSGVSSLTAYLLFSWDGGATYPVTGITISAVSSNAVSMQNYPVGATNMAVSVGAWTLSGTPTVTDYKVAK